MLVDFLDVDGRGDSRLQMPVVEMCANRNGVRISVLVCGRRFGAANVNDQAVDAIPSIDVFRLIEIFEPSPISATQRHCCGQPAPAYRAGPVAYEEIPWPRIY